ncbi:hypothetical protein Tco_0240010, partial [Tanacetum coccineum]
MFELSQPIPLENDNNPRVLPYYTTTNELNTRQCRWIELLSDYDFEIRYHLGKSNVVADALSLKERLKPLRVQALVMTINLSLPSQILDDEAVKEETVKEENLCGIDKEFKTRPNET